MPDSELSSGVLRHLLDHSNQGFLVLDDGPAFRPIYANARLAEMLGYDAPAGILALDSCLALVAEDDRAELLDGLEGRLGGDREVRGAHRGGFEPWLAVQIVRLPWGGRPVLCLIVTDVTAQKQLDTLAAGRDRELAHLDRLRTVYAMAAELVHELAQPLSAMQGYATAIEQAYARNKATPERVLRLVGKIRTCGDNVRSTVLRMRDFSRPDAAGGGEPCRTSAATAVRGAVEIAMRGIRRRNPNVRVALSLPADLPEISVDPVELQQVLVNLMQNAGAALPEDAPAGTRIIVSGERRSHRLVIKVTDTGAGMTPEVLSQIFNPFFTTKGDGMGLGLAICRRIVEGWGGRLSATSGPGRGTTMCFDVPFSGAAEA